MRSRFTMRFHQRTEAELQYRQCLNDARIQQDELVKVKERIVSHVRKLICQGDTVLKEVGATQRGAAQCKQHRLLQAPYTHLTVRWPTRVKTQQFCLMHLSWHVFKNKLQQVNWQKDTSLNKVQQKDCDKRLLNCTKSVDIKTMQNQQNTPSIIKKLHHKPVRRVEVLQTSRGRASSNRLKE